MEVVAAGFLSLYIESILCVDKDINLYICCRRADKSYVCSKVSVSEVREYMSHETTLSKIFEAHQIFRGKINEHNVLDIEPVELLDDADWTAVSRVEDFYVIDNDHDDSIWIEIFLDRVDREVDKVIEQLRNEFPFLYI